MMSKIFPQEMKKLVGQFKKYIDLQGNHVGNWYNRYVIFLSYQYLNVCCFYLLILPGRTIMFGKPNFREKFKWKSSQGEDRETWSISRNGLKSGWAGALLKRTNKWDIFLEAEEFSTQAHLTYCPSLSNFLSFSTRDKASLLSTAAMFQHGGNDT